MKTMFRGENLCRHLQQTEIKPAAKHQCDKCIALGDTWVHLRACQTCGEVNCCDNSKNQHATKHYHETGHPLVISAQPLEHWGWCYEHEIMAKWY